MEEIWKDVIGYEGLYQVSNLGRVQKLAEPKRIDKRGRIRGKDGRVLSPGKNSKGYHTVVLTKNKVPKSIKLHRLVLTHFLPNPLNLPEINHIDGNKLNNRVDNLEWCTRQQNMRHASKHKLLANLKGELNPAAKLSSDDVLYIRATKGRITAVELSKKLGVSPTAINDVRRGKTWRHLKRMGYSEDRLVHTRYE